MAIRRKDDTTKPHGIKKKQGFVVGPQTLPDGQWKRKNQRIKQDLIHKAKLKQTYSKLKSRLQEPESSKSKSIYDDETTTDTPPTSEQDPSLVENTPATTDTPDDEKVEESNIHPSRRPHHHRKPLPNVSIIVKKQAELDAKLERKKQLDQAQQEREVKLVERERFRKAMAKARTGTNNSGKGSGQRKLGREAGVLLEKVKRMIAT